MLNILIAVSFLGLSCGQILPPIFPPGHAPGDVIDSVDNEDINDALQDIVSAIGLFDGKGVALALANTAGGRLINPRYYVDNGEIYSHVPPYIDQGHSGLMLFTRKFFSLTGSEGVLTYQIEGTDYNVAVMWSNPFNEVLYKKAWNAKIYPTSETPDRAMFVQMFYVSDDMGTGGWHSRDEYGVNFYGSLTENNKAKFTLFTNSSGFDSLKGPDYHATCEGTLFKRCQVECTPLGVCKTDTTCKRDSDCDGNTLECSSECK